jgi:extracellular factor (EF) 3-hydroxypalmitic acid methyl ester biosynthesis protein
LVERGGPGPAEHEWFSQWLHEVADDIRTGLMPANVVPALRAAFGEALSADTLQGLSFIKPHGYAGDYEILEKIYLRHVSADPRYRNWDQFFQKQGAVEAVRNRKQYFIELLKDLQDARQADANVGVLDVACGSCRDVLEFLGDRNDERIKFDCLDCDAGAIAHARRLCRGFERQLSFIRANALRFRPTRRYRLIWCAGLFDYLDDAKFAWLLTRLFGFLEDGGELVIGNFSNRNPSRDYMELVGDWYLRHRDAGELVRLATAAGMTPDNIRVGQEACGINLFLHIKQS